MLSGLLLSLVVLDVSLPSVSLSFLSLGVAGSDLRLPLVVKLDLVFQGEELGGTAPWRGGEMGELESAGERGEEVGGRGLGGGEWQCSAAHLYSPVSRDGRMGCLRRGRLCWSVNCGRWLPVLMAGGEGVCQMRHCVTVDLLRPVDLACQVVDGRLQVLK